MSTRKQNRLEVFDYAQPGYYFVTICTKEKRKLFWDDSVGAACGRPHLSELGQIVEKEIKIMSNVYPQVSVDKYVVMPNHVHIIIVIHGSDGGRPQGAPTVSTIVNQFKGKVTKQAERPVWQKGFYDHIIRERDADYLRIWQYIDTNPAKWGEDCYNIGAETKGDIPL